jgi:hypothetical protein
MRELARVSLPLGNLVLLMAMLGAPAVRAGPTAHLFTEESQIVPEGDVALEQWIWAATRVPADPARAVAYYLWWAPTIGVSPHVELVLPVQVLDAEGETNLQSVGVEARYRVFSRENDEGFQPLVHLSYSQTLSGYFGPPRLALNLVATYGGPSTARLTGNLGAWMGLPFLANSTQAPALVGTGSLGVSFPLSAELRIAAETYGELPLVNAGQARHQLYVGPSLYWRRGPFWITFGSLVGLTRESSRFLPKVLWAVAI